MLFRSNRHKFGIDKGTKISDITEEYFFNKLNNLKLTKNKHSEFYVTALDGKQEIHFASEKTLKNVDKVEADLITKTIQDEDGNQITYAVDPGTGRLLFKWTPEMKAYIINNVLYVEYSDFNQLNSIIGDPKFNYQSVNFNLNGNINEIIKYIKTSNRIFPRNSMPALIDIFTTIKIDPNTNKPI